jgi:outer membrane lipoprotein SlyB
MWALGLIVGTLVGAVVAQGAGAFVGAIIGVVAGIIVGSQREGIKRRIDALESQMLNLEARIRAVDERSAVARGISAAPAATSTASA